MGYTSAKAMNTSYNLDSTNLALGSFILVSFLVGMAMNGLLLWLLWKKMGRTVNTLWFLHLTLSFLISCCSLPFFGVYNLLNFHWVFDVFMCKITYFFLTLGMVSTVFLLTIISLDRYLLTCRPIWAQHNRSIPLACRLIIGVWLVSLVVTAPYLAFSVTQEVGKDKSVCKLNYTSDKWNGDQMELAIFMTRFLLTFLLPFFIIVFCYCSMRQEMKKKRLLRTGKPFKILVIAVASFFIFRFPFYLYMISSLANKPNPPGKIQEFLRITFSIGICLNICFTPILYLFVGENFKQVFKTSIVVLVKKGFTEHSIMSMENMSLRAETIQTSSSSNLELAKTQRDDLPPS
ncbi:probable G-protein coupled receptor 33 [Sceloporus undulatus]|uniref:probable G-protein coupled receptor 33 n=1 Tax=Sceloporus undulatus TaxID=8520 RepID=UPI001C4D3E90|nr:probable G-protein coupled receptor 33 [Sceloporus undulatus]